MTKKKKESLGWRILRNSAEGLKKRVVEAKEKRRIRRNPAYKVNPKNEPLEHVRTVAGNFDTAIERLHGQSNVTLIFGKRGSGKSALGFRILENVFDVTRRPCYVIDIDPALLPFWIKSIKSIEEAPSGAVVLVDEGAVSFNSRNSMSSKNRELVGLLATARHRDQSLIFVTQNTGLIDKTVLKLADSLLIKEGSLLQLEMERAEMKSFYERAHKSIQKLSGDKKKFVYVFDNDFEGVVSHSLPSFWSERISKNQSNKS